MSAAIKALKSAKVGSRTRAFIPPRHGPRPTRLSPAFLPVNPSNLVAKQGNGYNLFVPQLRKLIFEYCERSEQSSRMRSYLLNHVEDVARENPHVEVVVKTRTLKPPVIRGLYC
jgi:large subunit ribosomal protein L43